MADLQLIQSKIFEIRGQRVMLDRDLAELYQVTTGNLNKAVKRNIRRFPPDFMFQLTKEEFELLRQSLIFQNGISNEELKDASGILRKGRGGVRQLPYAFTEQGLAMLSGVLNSSIAIDVNISIMRLLWLTILLFLKRKREMLLSIFFLTKKTNFSGVTCRLTNG